MSAPLTTYYNMVLPEYTDPSDVKDLNDNFEIIDAALHTLNTGKKPVQTAVTDPTASGNSFSFIDTFAQATDGKATVTKKTVPDMGAASAGAAGSKGLVPAPAAGDNTKFLRGDKTWAVPTNTTYSDFTGATSGAAGAHGLVPAPAAGDQVKYLRGDKTWAVPTNTTYESKAAASGGTAVSLCTTGEKYTWNNKLSSHQTIKQDGITGATIGRFGTCSTAAATAAKTVSITAGTFSLEAGAIVAVSFSNANTAGTPTLNVNSKGAKNIFVNGAQITSSAAAYGLLKGTVLFIYDGTQWHLIGNYYDSGNTTYSAGTGLSLSGTTFSLPNSGATAGTYGPTANVTGNNNATIKVPKITIDAQGRVTAIAEYTFTAVNTYVNTTYSAGTGLSLSGTTFSLGTSGATAGTYGPTADVTGTNGTTIKVPKITVDAYGRVTAITHYTYTSVNTDTNTDTKNTAGATNTTSKIFLIGATAQDANPQTYSHSTCYEQNGDFYDTKLHNAVWNDYAECRESNETQPGRVVRETIMGVMVKTERRRMRGCRIISDTYGTIMGETDKAKTPIGVAGRVLAYPARDRSKFYLGAPVCSGPDGTVDVMSRLEAILFPECIIGTVSEIPRYEKWFAGDRENPTEIEVNGRIWIYVR